MKFKQWLNEEKIKVGDWIINKDKVVIKVKTIGKGKYNSTTGTQYSDKGWKKVPPNDVKKLEKK